jgi:hypothetical protein
MMVCHNDGPTSSTALLSLQPAVQNKNETTQEKHFRLLTEQSAAAQSYENRLPVFSKVSLITFAQKNA